MGGCLPQTLQQQGQGTLSPAGLHDPLSHGSWGQLQAPSYSWFLNSRTRSRACYLRSTQTPGRNHVCSPQQGRVAGSPSGRDPNPRSSLTRQGTPWRPPDKDSERRDGPGPPQRNVAGSPHPSGLCSQQWSLGPEASGCVYIFAPVGSGERGASACSHAHGPASGWGAHLPPFPLEPVGETKQPEREATESAEKTPRSGEGRTGTDRQMKRGRKQWKGERMKQEERRQVG